MGGFRQESANIRTHASTYTGLKQIRKIRVNIAELRSRGVWCACRNIGDSNSAAETSSAMSASVAPGLFQQRLAGRAGRSIPFGRPSQRRPSRMIRRGSKLRFRRTKKKGTRRKFSIPRKQAGATLMNFAQDEGMISWGVALLATAFALAVARAGDHGGRDRASCFDQPGGARSAKALRLPGAGKKMNRGKLIIH